MSNLQDSLLKDRFVFDEYEDDANAYKLAGELTTKEKLKLPGQSLNKRK